MLLRHCVQIFEDLAGHQAEQGLLALEMIEEGGGCDVREFRDLVDGRRLETLLGEEVAGDGENALADFALAAFAAAEGWRFGCRIGWSCSGRDFGRQGSTFCLRVRLASEWAFARRF